MIVEDINNTDVVGPNMIVGALAATCAECLSTPNAGQLANKVNAQSDYNDRPRDKPKNIGQMDFQAQGSHNGQLVHKNGIGLPNATDVVKWDIPNLSAPIRTRPTPKLEAKIHQYQFRRQKLKNSPLVIMERRDHNANAGDSAMVCGATAALREQQDQVCGTRPEQEGVGLVARCCKREK